MLFVKSLFNPRRHTMFWVFLLLLFLAFCLVKIGSLSVWFVVMKSIISGLLFLLLIGAVFGVIRVLFKK